MKRKQKKSGTEPKREPRMQRRDDVHVIVGGRSYQASEVRIKVGNVTLTWQGSASEVGK